MATAIDADDLVRYRAEDVFNRMESEIWERLLKEFSLENFRVSIPFSDLLSDKEWDVLCALEGGSEEVIARMRRPFSNHKFSVSCTSRWGKSNWENFVSTERPTEMVLTPHSLAEIPD